MCHLGKDTSFPQARLVLMEDDGDGIELLLSERGKEEFSIVMWEVHPGPPPGEE